MLTNFVDEKPCCGGIVQNKNVRICCDCPIASTLQSGSLKSKIKEDEGIASAARVNFLPERNLRLENINPLILNFKAMEYAARGPVIMRTIEIEGEMAKGILKPFEEVIKANLGDAQAMGQKPITFLRQVLASVTCPELMATQIFPADVQNRAKAILKGLRGQSVGTYTDSRGLEIVRRHVAEYISHRDAGIPAFPDDIFLSAGASDGIRACLKLLKTGNGQLRAGCLTPIPEYPLYNASLAEFDIAQVGYYLDESDNWSINIKELEKVIQESKGKVKIRAIVVINPGNPTGHVLRRRNMEEVIRLAFRQNLVILADEVYQENVYGETTFLSFKRVMAELQAPFSSVELISFFSCSKGYVCECGIRGGYFETVNIDREVKSILQASIAAKLCSPVLSQVAVDCAVKPPLQGFESYEKFHEEKTVILDSLEVKAKLVEEIFNSLPGISCTKILGAMYAFPRLSLPEKAIKVAKSRGLEPDVFYALELLESEGICVVPGSGLGQMPGTYHFRTTILPPLYKLKIMLQRFTVFHNKFLATYGFE